MLKKIITLALEQRLIVLLLSLMIGLWGLVELQRTPLDALPDLSDVQVIVKTTYPGQAPQLIEQQITYPLSNVLLAVPGAKTVRGYSFFGDSYIYVIFDDNTDLYWARSRVQETLSQSQNILPKGLQPRIGPDASGVGWVFEYALVDRSGTQNLAELTSLQNWYLKQGLQSVAGVAEVATIGGMNQSYQIVLNPSQLVDHKIDIDTVVKAVQQSNNDVGGSVIEMGEAEYMVRSPGYLTNIEQIQQIPLGKVSASGRAILLKDVANIRLGPAARRGIAELDGQGEVVGGIVVMRYDQNALTTIQSVKAKLKQLESGLPDGVEVVATYDRSQLIESSVDNLLFKISEEMLIVTLVCLIFLFHARSTLVAVIVLPLSVLGAFILMRQLGINANIMSLGGIAIAIGAVVDGAIVMVENFHKHVEHFEDEFNRIPSQQEHWHLVLKSSTQVGPALFFSLLIITLSFVPVFALEAQEGRLFSPLAYTKTFAMAVAALLSITLIPVLIGFIVRGRIPKETSNPLSRMLIALYKPVINIVLEYPKITISLAIIIFASSFYPLSNSGSEFMPELEEGDLLYMPTTLPGISAAKAGQILQQTDRLIKTIPEVKRVFGKIGRADTATDPAPLTMIETTIMLQPKSQWRKGMTLEKLINELQQTVKIPGLTNAWVQPIKTRIDMLSTGIKTPVGIKISGNNIETLEEIGQQVEGILSQVTGTRSVYAERSSSGRYLDISPKSGIAARYGINQKQIQDVVQYAIGGMTVSESIQNTERYPINVRYPRNIRDNLEQLQQLPIITKQGHYLPLNQVADISINRGAPMMKSENGRLISWVFVDLDNVSIGEYIQSANIQLKQKLKLPARYTYEFAGQYEYMQRVKDKLTMVIPATLAIIFILLLMTFGQAQQAIIVMSSLPFALVGSAWLLFALDMNYSAATAIGMIALTGVAAEFSVIMLLYLNNAIDDAKSQGKYQTLSDLKSAISHGAVMRIRPKAMTVATIFFGLLPVMWGSGSGNEVMQNIAAPMIGGMITAPILSLLVLPALYLLINQNKLNQD